MTPLRPIAASPARRAGPQSVGRIFAILDAIAGLRRGATLSELARIARAPKTSLVGLLAGLTQEGCLLRDANGRYTLGPRVHALLARTLQGRDLVAQARPILQRLVDETGETAAIGALAPDADLAVYLDRVESPNPIRYAVTIGERRELYCTALGRALLAHFEPARLRAYLRDTPRERWTPSTQTSVAEILAEVERVRRDGLARTHGERVAGASAIAAPVSGSDGAVAALMIAGPAERMRANQRRNEQAMRACAAELVRMAGGDGSRRAGGRA